MTNDGAKIWSTDYNRVTIVAELGTFADAIKMNHNMLNWNIEFSKWMS